MAAVFVKQLLIDSLNEKIAVAEKQKAKAEAEYTVSVDKWKATVTARLQKRIDSFNGDNAYSFFGHDFDPPSKPSGDNGVTKYKATIKQLQMMDGDTVKLAPTDNILSTAL